jgi:hypothetical protein
MYENFIIHQSANDVNRGGKTMKFRKKPVVIEAVKFEGFMSVTGQVVFSERPIWINDAIGKEIRFFDRESTLTIQTLEKSMYAKVGDYIIRGVQGELYPCKPDIFKATYEAVEDGE